MNPLTNSAGTSAPAELVHLYRIRNGVRAALTLGVAASVAGNVLHAEPTIVGRAIASWSPLALLLTVELISRVPVSNRALAVLRMSSTAVIAGIAAWVSYWHMVSVAARNGESTTSAHLLPLSVDGLVVVASVSLVEIAARLRHASTLADASAAGEPSAAAVTASETAPETAAAVEADAEPVPAPRPAPRAPMAARRPSRPAVKSAAGTVARLRDKHPEWTVGQIAAKAGVAERTVRRHLNAAAAPAAAGPVPDIGPADGDAADVAA